MGHKHLQLTAVGLPRHVVEEQPLTGREAADPFAIHCVQKAHHLFAVHGVEAPNVDAAPALAVLESAHAPGGIVGVRLLHHAFGRNPAMAPT